jgi:hypothetical protein
MTLLRYKTTTCFAWQPSSIHDESEGRPMKTNTGMNVSGRVSAASLVFAAVLFVPASGV